MQTVEQQQIQACLHAHTEKNGVDKMAFSKTGDTMEVEAIYCSCGGEIDRKTRKCKKCGEDYKGPVQQDTPKDEK